MDTRRDFIKKSAIMGAALCLPISLTRESQAAYPDLKTRAPKKALILWYSQTGLTRRYARLIGCILKSKNLAVDEIELQETNKKMLPDYDLIIIGTPVFYYDTPSNVSEWLGNNSFHQGHTGCSVCFLWRPGRQSAQRVLSHSKNSGG